MFHDPRISVLIRQSIKAAAVRHGAPTINARRQGGITLQAFGIVAADVLGIVMAPAGWENAAMETLHTIGLPPQVTPTSSTADRDALDDWFVRADDEMRRRVTMIGGSF